MRLTDTTGPRRDATPASGAASVDEALAKVLDGMDRRAAELAEAVLAGAEEVPDCLLDDVAGTIGDLLRITWRCAVDATCEEPDEAEDDTELAAIAEDCVAAGLGLDVVLRVVRCAHQEISMTVFAQQLRVGPGQCADLDAMTHASAITFSYVERTIAGLVSAHDAAVRRRARSGEQQRVAALDALLRDEHGDVARLEADLGYELGAKHVAFLLRSDPGTKPLESLEHLAQVCAASLGGTALLQVRRGSCTLFCWTAVDEERTVGEELCHRLTEAGVRLVLGTAQEGLEGFRLSYDELNKADRVARLVGLERPAVAYADVALLSMLTNDLDAARDYVAARLGRLVGADQRTRNIAETLEVYYEEGHNQTRTAARLGVHVKSVAYRIRRAEEVLRHPVDRKMYETWTALALLRLLRGQTAIGVSGLVRAERDLAVAACAEHAVAA